MERLCTGHSSRLGYICKSETLARPKKSKADFCFRSQRQPACARGRRLLRIVLLVTVESPTTMSSTSNPLSNEDGAIVVEMDKFDRQSSMEKSAHPHVPEEPDAARFSLSGAGHISLDEVEAVDVQIRDLAVTVDTSPSWWDPATYPELAKSKFNPEPSSKNLIYHVNASLQPGTLTAIIGGSGSGKTTLLNTLSERMISARLAQSGHITFNGSEGIHNARHAYVMQQDILLPSLTVRETLQYSADLRLPPPTTAKERARIVEEVILELGLKECSNTRIGDRQHRGCSGGEKRRVSIGVQLLANPSVLFLDEPTTGLDATSAFQLMRTLKKLATKGRNIITTIHQPRSEIWDLFDNLIILTKGSPVFSGPAKNCVPFFEGLGFKLPPFVNPAEYVIDIAAIDNRTPELEQETTERVSQLKQAWIHESKTIFAPTDKAIESTSRGKSPTSKTSKHASYTRQLRVLTNRTFKVTYRDPMGMLASTTEAILMALVTGYIFYNLPRDLSGIRSRQGALYTAAGLQGYLTLMFEVYRLTVDIPTYDREHSESCVDAIPFLFSRRLARLFTEDLPVPFLFSIIFYFMGGFERDASQFFIFFAITVLNHYIAVTCAITCVTASRNFPGASLIANMVFTLQSMACGMFIQANSIPVYVRWLKWITYSVSPNRRAFGMAILMLPSSIPLAPIVATSSRVHFTIAHWRAGPRTQNACSTRADSSWSLSGFRGIGYGGPLSCSLHSSSCSASYPPSDYSISSKR